MCVFPLYIYTDTNSNYFIDGRVVLVYWLTNGVCIPRKRKMFVWSADVQEIQPRMPEPHMLRGPNGKFRNLRRA